MVIVQVNDDGADRQALLRAGRTAAHLVVEAVEQQVEALRADAVRVARDPVDAFVGGAERARAAAPAVVLAERLIRPPLDSLEHGVGQLALLQVQRFDHGGLQLCGRSV
jgi:hypothetical protein